MSHRVLSLVAALVLVCGCKPDKCKDRPAEVEIRVVPDSALAANVQGTKVTLDINGGAAVLTHDFPSVSDPAFVFELGEHDQPPRTLVVQVAAYDGSGQTIGTGQEALGFSSDGCNFVTVSLSPSAVSDAGVDVNLDLSPADLLPADTVPADIGAPIVLDPLGKKLLSTSGSIQHLGIAFGGGLYFLVWEVNDDIYGARVAPDGSSLDSSGIPICIKSDYQGWPDVSYDGTNFLVVWQSGTVSSGGEIHGARVSKSGGLLDPTGIKVAAETGAYFERPSVASDGNESLVVWEHYTDVIFGGGIFASRVDKGGTVIDSPGNKILSRTAPSMPSVAFDGTNYFVAFHCKQDVEGVRVDKTMNVLDSDGIQITTGDTVVNVVMDVVFGGNHSLTVWTDTRGAYSTGWDIYGARVSQTGSVVDTAGAAISTAGHTQSGPAVSFDGKNFFVVWSDERNSAQGNDGGFPGFDIYGTRLDQTGTVLDGHSGIPIGAKTVGGPISRSPAIAFDGANYLVVWIGYPDNGNLYGARVKP